MRGLAIGLTIAIVASAASAERYVPPDMLMYVACLRSQARAMDDRVSDARTISTAIVALCRASRRDYLVKQDPKNIMLPPLYQPANSSDVDAGVAIVLQERAAASKSPAKPAVPVRPKTRGEQI